MIFDLNDRFYFFPCFFLYLDTYVFVNADLKYIKVKKWETFSIILCINIKLKEIIMSLNRSFSPSV